MTNIQSTNKEKNIKKVREVMHFSQVQNLQCQQVLV